MNKDEALGLALEALELHGKQYPYMVKGYCLDAIKAIKEALKTKDEPVYWEMPDGKIVDKWGLQFYRGDTGTPLYTTPQQRTWVWLTDKEVDECLRGLPTQTIDVYARRIETKIKDKNT
jgi:hypothetical protein